MSVFNTEGVKQRKTAVHLNGATEAPTATQAPVKDERDHPAGPVKHGGPMQAARILLFGVFFTVSCVL